MDEEKIKQAAVNTYLNFKPNDRPVKFRLSSKEINAVRRWWRKLPAESRDYFNSYESQTKPSVSLLEAVEAFGEDAKPVLNEKLNDLSRLEAMYQNLLEAKVAAAQRTFTYNDSFLNWFLTRAVTIKTATKLAEIKKERKNISRALLLTTKGENKDLERRVEAAKQIPIESLYTGKLKRSSKKRLVGICPFHNEKTPSFTIYLKGNSWYCFGACKTGGDSIDFIQKLEHLDFKSAVRRLA